MTDLENRVVRALIASGDIKRRRPTRLWLGIAAAAALFVMVIAHPWSRPERAYVVLLYNDSTYRWPAAAQMGVREAEYGRWADSVRAERGGKLLGPGAINGLFIVRAPDDRAAERLGETCPHIKYGGHVEVRRFVE